MKCEWKKQERELYGTKDKPQRLRVPTQRFLMTQGHGDPNGEDFAERVSVLYALAYAVKSEFKASQSNGSYDEYVVYPLEGVWETSNNEDLLDKDSFAYTLMIRQPDAISQEMFEAARRRTAKKKPHPLLAGVAFGAMEDGESVQLLHIGTFDSEPASFAKMEAFAKANGLERCHSYHREIYLNDARKTAPEKRKTLLRFGVRESGAQKE